MAQLTLRINGYAYTVGCEDGQEAHLEAMAGEVQTRIDSIKSLGGQSGESKLLVLAALLMADELHDRQAEIAALERVVPGAGGKASRQLTGTIARLADKAERIATELEQS